MEKKDNNKKVTPKDLRSILLRKAKEQHCHYRTRIVIQGEQLENIEAVEKNEQIRKEIYSQIKELVIMKRIKQNENDVGIIAIERMLINKLKKQRHSRYKFNIKQMVANKKTWALDLRIDIKDGQQSIEEEILEAYGIIIAIEKIIEKWMQEFPRIEGLIEAGDYLNERENWIKKIHKFYHEKSECGKRKMNFSTEKKHELQLVDLLNSKWITIDQSSNEGVFIITTSMKRIDNKSQVSIKSKTEKTYENDKSNE